MSVAFSCCTDCVHSGVVVGDAEQSSQGNSPVELYLACRTFTDNVISSYPRLFCRKRQTHRTVRLPLSQKLEQATTEAIDHRRYLLEWGASLVDMRHVVIGLARKSL
jgi:hypothetical protein